MCWAMNSTPLSAVLTLSEAFLYLFTSGTNTIKTIFAVTDDAVR